MEENSRHIDFNLMTKYLAGEASPREAEEVRAWMVASQENREEYDVLVRTWDSLGKIQPGEEIDIEREWQHHQELIGGKGYGGHIVRIGIFIRLAASIMILLGVGLLVRQQINRESFRTLHAETFQTVLPDGSTVTLNASSKLQYDKKFMKEERRVSLEGEAYFEITRDTLKPFIIALGDAEVRVLGTEFNVRAYTNSGKIEVTVTEGRVSLYEKDRELKKVIAEKGEKAEYIRAEKLITKVENPNRNFLSWKTRILRFEDDKLSDVVQILTEVYHQPIVLKNDTIGNCKLNTLFEERDLEMVLEVITSTLDLTLVKEKGIIVLDGQGCE